MIKVDNISKKFDNKYIWKHLSFDIPDNEKLLIIGPSGCGKTTLIRCLNGFEKIDSGKILLNGVNIKDIDEITLKSKVGMVFQNFNLFPHLTVGENIALAPKILKLGSKEEINKRVRELLNQVHILDKIDSYPKRLSGGEKQRVAIARALATKPEIILFDEPTSALDPGAVNDLLELLDELSKTTTIVVVSHEMDLIENYADKILFLKDKGILEYGTRKEILNSKNIEIREFLGKE